MNRLLKHLVLLKALLRVPLCANRHTQAFSHRALVRLEANVCLVSNMLHLVAVGHTIALRRAIGLTSHFQEVVQVPVGLGICDAFVLTLRIAADGHVAVMRGIVEPDRGYLTLWSGVETLLFASVKREHGFLHLHGNPCCFVLFLLFQVL